MIVAEPDSESVRARLSEDGHVVTWAWTRTGITSAIERRAREGSLSRQQRYALERLCTFAHLASVFGSWNFWRRCFLTS